MNRGTNEIPRLKRISIVLDILVTIILIVVVISLHTRITATEDTLDDKQIITIKKTSNENMERSFLMFALAIKIASSTMLLVAESR